MSICGTCGGLGFTGRRNLKDPLLVICRDCGGDGLSESPCRRHGQIVQTGCHSCERALGREHVEIDGEQ